MVIAFDLPDDKMDAEVRELTGKDGKIILLSVDGKSKEARALKQRYGFCEAGAVLTDEYGNLLKAGLKDSEAIVDAYYELDELMAGAFQSWSEAIEKGDALIKRKEYPKAAQVLQVFAFASGTDEALKGKKLFDEVAKAASAEFEPLEAEARKVLALFPDAEKRTDLRSRLSSFAKKWPKTPSAFAAEAMISEMEASKKAL